MDARLTDGTRLRATLLSLDTKTDCRLNSPALGTEFAVPAEDLRSLDDAAALIPAASQQPARITLRDGSVLCGQFLFQGDHPAWRDSAGTAHPLRLNDLREVRQHSPHPRSLQGPLSPADWQMNAAHAEGPRLILPDKGSEVIRQAVPPAAELELRWRGAAGNALTVMVEAVPVNDPAEPGNTLEPAAETAESSHGHSAEPRKLFSVSLAGDQLRTSVVTHIPLGEGRTHRHTGNHSESNFATLQADDSYRLRVVWNQPGFRLVVQGNDGSVREIQAMLANEPGHTLQLRITSNSDSVLSLERVTLRELRASSLPAVPENPAAEPGIWLQDGIFLAGATLTAGNDTVASATGGTGPTPGADQDFVLQLADGQQMRLSSRLFASWQLPAAPASENSRPEASTTPTPLAPPSAPAPAPAGWKLRLDDGSELLISSLRTVDGDRIEVEHPLLGPISLPRAALLRLERWPAPDARS